MTSAFWVAYEVVGTGVAAMLALISIWSLAALWSVAFGITLAAAHFEHRRQHDIASFDFLCGLSVMFLLWAMTASLNGVFPKLFSIYVHGTTMSALTFFHFLGVAAMATFFVGRRILASFHAHPWQRE